MKKQKIIKKRKKNLIYLNFKESLSCVLKNFNYIYFAILAFIMFLLLALFFNTPPQLEQQIKLMIQKLVLRTENLNTFQLVSFIFVNNLTVGIAAVVLGIFFCIAPIIIASSNGYVLGYVIKITIGKLGLANGIFALWRILPHGVFELPAIFISLGFGIKLGTSLFYSLNKNSFKLFLNDLNEAFKILVYVVIPLLVIAAIIEGILIKFL